MSSLKNLQSISLASLLLLFTLLAGCSQFINKPLSSEYVAGQKLAEIYAKQDAIDDKCIYYPVSLNSKILRNTSKHIKTFKGEKSKQFIDGFSRSYNDEYIEYMNLYCDSLDSPKEYETEKVKP